MSSDPPQHGPRRYDLLDEAWQVGLVLVAHPDDVGYGLAAAVANQQLGAVGDGLAAPEPQESHA